MSRAYPRGTRFDSSNYDPAMAWFLGFQLVALNFQVRLRWGRGKAQGRPGAGTMHVPG